MLNIVEKYAAETERVDEDGAVTIEYVLLAAAIAGLLVGFATGLFGKLQTKLDEIL